MSIALGIAAVIAGLVVSVPGMGFGGPGLPQGQADCNANGVPDESEFVARFRPLGDFPGGGASSAALAVSANGAVVVGVGNPAGPFRWTAAEGMVRLGPDPTFIVPTDVSADGSVLVGLLESFGWVHTSTGFRWTDPTGWAELEPRFDGLMTPPAVSADGSMVVLGECKASFSDTTCLAYRWTPQEQMVSLGYPSEEFQDSAATGISVDGSVIVGFGRVAPFTICECTGLFCGGGLNDGIRWKSGEAMSTMGLPLWGCTGLTIGGLSADGTVVFGGGRSSDAAFRWTVESGMQELGSLPGGFKYSEARGIPGDGSILVGSVRAGNERMAFIWDVDHGMRSLRSVLADQYGLDLTGWVLNSANDVSDDGRTIVGEDINPEGHNEAWVATLPAVDSDGDGVMESCDLCPGTADAAILSIGGCRTTVANTVSAVGCSLADELARGCPLSSAPNAHGVFVACVANLADHWRSEGRIDLAEVGRVVSCAASLR